MTTDPNDQHQEDQSKENGKKNDGGKHERRMYLRFGAMIATSTVVMFVLTYTNVFSIDPCAVE